MSLLKNSAIYTAMSFLQKGLAFFMLPLYTYKLTAAEFGTVGTLTSLLGVFMAFSLFSINGAAFKFMYDLSERDDEGRQKVWDTLFIMVVGFALMTTVCLFFLYPPFISRWIPSIDFNPYILIILITLFSNTIFTFEQSRLQAYHKASRYTIQNFILFVLIISLNFIFLFPLNLKAEGLLLATAIANGTFAVYFLFKNRGVFVKKLDFSLMKKAFWYSLPLLPHTLSGWLISMLDRLLLNSKSGIESVGVYNVGIQLALPLSIVSLAILNAFRAWFFEKLNEGGSGRSEIALISESVTGFFVLISLILAVFASELVRLVSPMEYWGASSIIPWVLLGHVFQGIYYFVVGSVFKHNTKVIPLITLISSVVSVIANLYFIDSYGVLGAGISYALSMGLTFLLTFWVSQKYENIPYKLPKLIFVPITFFAIGLFFNSFFLESLILTIMIKLLVITILGFILYSLYKELVHMGISKIQAKFRG